MQQLTLEPPGLAARPSAPSLAQALARPLSLALHTPTQALVMLCIWWRNPAICAAPVLQHPAAQRHTAATYGALSAVVRAGSPMPLPCGFAQHGPLGQCRAVLTLAELALGFLAPTLVLALSEAELHRRWRRTWVKWKRNHLGPGGGGGGGGGGRREGAAGVPARAVGQLDTDTLPCITRAGRAAVLCYDLLLKHPLTDPADAAVAALTATLLLGAAWQAILAITPL